MNESVQAQKDVTPLLAATRAGDTDAARELLIVVYDELRRRAAALMRWERGDHTLQPTALVHEVFLELVPQQAIGWNDRAHFFAAASQKMRRILVEHARARRAKKRGGDMTRMASDALHRFSASEDADVLAIEAVLVKLAQLNARHAEIVAARLQPRPARRQRAGLRFNRSDFEGVDRVCWSVRHARVSSPADATLGR